MAAEQVRNFTSGTTGLAGSAARLNRRRGWNRQRE
jgi:hypothetical protein